MTHASIDIRDLVVSRSGKQVLHGISFTIVPGIISTLLGANGAGKSTTVMALAGALPLQSGAVNFGSVMLSGKSPDAIRRLGIALVPEGHRVLGQLNVEENLAVASPCRNGKERQDGLEKVYEIFPELKPMRARSASELSGGQKQMVAMGQAFMADPSFIIVDELSLGLAPTVVKRLAKALQQAARRGIGVLLIEQFASLALELAERAMVLERGRLTYDGPSDTLRNNPQILHSAYLAQ